MMNFLHFGSWKKQKAAVGIDFGTTKSAIALLQSSDTGVQIVNQQGGDRSLRMVASIGRISGELPQWIVLGKALDNTEVVRNFKVALGVESSSEASAKIYKAGIEPEGLAAFTLASLRSSLETALSPSFNRAGGELPTEATICVPAKWPYLRRKALLLAARVAGFSDVNLVEEPLATLGAIQKRLSDDLTLVIDYGGGTCDLAVVKKAGEQISVERVASRPFGGQDIDLALGQFVLGNRYILTHESLREVGAELPCSSKAHDQVLYDSQEHKEDRNDRLRGVITSSALMRDDRIRFSTDELSEDARWKDIPDEEIENIIDSQVLSMKLMLDEFLGWASHIQRIRQVVLSGGSSQLYCVGNIVRSFFSEHDLLPIIEILGSPIRPQESAVAEESPNWSVVAGCVHYQDHILKHQRPPDWHLPDYEICSIDIVDDSEHNLERIERSRGRSTALFTRLDVQFNTSFLEARVKWDQRIVNVIRVYPLGETNAFIPAGETILAKVVFRADSLIGLSIVKPSHRFILKEIYGFDGTSQTFETEDDAIRRLRMKYGIVR